MTMQGQSNLNLLKGIKDLTTNTNYGGYCIHIEVLKMQPWHSAEDSLN